MAIEMKVPTVGESISEVTIAQWLKKTGDFVQMDEIIAELESDKATFELTAEAAGVLTTFGNEGDTIEIGAKICEIDPKEAVKEAPNPTKTQEKANTTSSGEVIEMHVPTVGESINEVTISSWLKADGDRVALDEVIAEIESDKATFELTAEANGILKIIVQEGTTIEIGTLICKIEVIEAGSTEKSTPQAPELPTTNPSGASGGAGYAANHASPAAAKILSEKGIHNTQVQGTGVGGRITKEDAVNAQKTPPKTISSTPPASTSAMLGERSQRREKMTSLRKTISRRLVAVKNDTAMLTTFNEVNMQPIMDLRKKYKDAFKDKYEVGLGFMSFFAKACCMALEEWPAVNATIDGEEIVYNNYCDISVAVSTPRGLVVPVVRNAEKLSFAEIEKEIINLATKARDGKLSIEEMTGGTFTITNGGVFGSMLSTPIINAPQSAILGMHNIVERPVVENGAVVVRPIMFVALSYDHRIIDGKESVSFLVRVKQLLEDPSRLLLGI